MRCDESDADAGEDDGPTRDRAGRTGDRSGRRDRPGDGPALAARGYRLGLIDRADGPLGEPGRRAGRRGGTVAAEAADVREPAGAQGGGRRARARGRADRGARRLRGGRDALVGARPRPRGVPRDARGQRARRGADDRGGPAGDVRAGAGHIVGISSVAGYRGLPWMPGYSASKAALATYLEGLRPGSEAARGADHDRLSRASSGPAMTADTPFRSPVKMLEPEEAAEYLVRAIVRRPRDCDVPALRRPRHGPAPPLARPRLRLGDGPRRARGADHRVLNEVTCLGMLRLANTTASTRLRRRSRGPVALPTPWRCIACGLGLEWDGSAARAAAGRIPRSTASCTRSVRLRGTNRIAAAFYDGPSWPRFRPWEQLFLWFQGPGPARARRQVLRHLPAPASARVLEVGIGDGANLPLLPPGWTVYGVDIARSQLALCRDRMPAMAGRLAWAEAEALPFADATFDAVYTVGGFNYFRDPVRAIREMRRVARPGGARGRRRREPRPDPVLPGPALGIDLIDRWALRAMGLDAEFVAMVSESPARRRRRRPRGLPRPSPRSRSGTGWAIVWWTRRRHSTIIVGDPSIMNDFDHRQESSHGDDQPERGERLDGRARRAPLRGLRRADPAARRPRPRAEPAFACVDCGRSYPIRDGVLVVKEEPRPTTGSRADFYNSPLWPKFRFWEWIFWVSHGGERRCRERDPPPLAAAARAEAARRRDRRRRLHELAAPRLEHRRHRRLDRAARQLPPERTPSRDLRLVLGEAEALPFRDRQFDAVSQHRRLQPLQRPRGRPPRDGPRGPARRDDRHLRRAAQLDGPDAGPQDGLPGLDRWIVSRLMNLGYDFTDLVERHRHHRHRRDRPARAPQLPLRAHLEGRAATLMVGQAP